MSYTKGALGHVLDLRQAMGEVREASREWCAALDASDNEAMTHLGELLGEAMKSVAEAACAVKASANQASKKGASR